MGERGERGTAEFAEDDAEEKNSGCPPPALIAFMFPRFNTINHSRFTIHPHHTTTEKQAAKYT